MHDQGNEDDVARTRAARAPVPEGAPSPDGGARGDLRGDRARVVHDLRNVLTALKYGCHLVEARLGEGRDARDARECLGEMRAQLEIGASLVERLRDVEGGREHGGVRGADPGRGGGGFRGAAPGRVDRDVSA